MESHLNGRWSDAKGFGGLLNVSVFEFAEDEDLPVSKGKSDEGTADEAADLLAFKSLRWNFAPVGE